MYKKLKGLGLIVLTMVVAVVIWEVLKKFGTYSPASFAAFAVIITIILVIATIVFTFWSFLSTEMTSRKERRIAILLYLGTGLCILYLVSNQGIVRQLRIADVLAPLMTTGLFIMFAIFAYSRFSGVFGSTQVQVVDPDANTAATVRVPVTKKITSRVTGTIRPCFVVDGVSM